VEVSPSLEWVARRCVFGSIVYLCIHLALSDLCVNSSMYRLINSSMY
jgi:hypothetical protein